MNPECNKNSSSGEPDHGTQGGVLRAFTRGRGGLERLKTAGSGKCNLVVSSQMSVILPMVFLKDVI